MNANAAKMQAIPVSPQVKAFYRALGQIAPKQLSARVIAGGILTHWAEIASRRMPELGETMRGLEPPIELSPQARRALSDLIEEINFPNEGSIEATQ